MLEDKLISISIQLEASVVSEIKTLISKTEIGSGKATGLAPWIRRVIYRTLNIPIPVRNYKLDPEIDIRHVDSKKLNLKTKTVVKLWNKGYTALEVAKWLNERQIPTLRSGNTWTRKSVIAILQNLAKKHA